MKKQIVNLFNKTFSLIDKGTLSVGQLEKNLLHSSKQRRRLEDKTIDRLPTMSKNNSDFKIISPFYDRNKVCKALNCHCPYHKRIKEEAIKKYQIRSRKIFNSTMQSPEKGHRGSEHHQYPRLSHNILSKNKQNKSIESRLDYSKFNGSKINSYNFQFEQFLKLTNHLLLNRQYFGKINEHTIKNSVGEIFQYIYTHLDDQRKDVADFIEKIEKDRDLTNFYMDRYDDLKRRKLENPSGFKPKFAITNGFQKKKAIRDDSKQTTRLTQRKGTIVPRKTNKQKNQRVLIMDRLIRIVKQGNQVDDSDIEILAQIHIDTFQENCNALKKRIGTFDFDMMQNIKEQILLKLDKYIKDHQEVSEHERKEQIIQQLLKIVEDRFSELQSEQYENQCQREQYDRISSSYNKLSNTRKGSCQNPSKKRSSKFNDIARKTVFLQENNANSNQNPNHDDDNYQDLIDSIQNRQKKIEENESHNVRFNTAFAKNESQNDDLPESLKKNQGKLKLAKYRRLSHDGFFMKHNTSGDQSTLFIPKIKIQSVEDIAYGLDTMAMQFGDKWKKIKQIQRRISTIKMKKYIICEDDALITAKRKVRMLKNLLKQDVFQGALRQQIRQYVSLIQQFNLLKNRHWAQKKLRNMMNLNNDDIQIIEGKDESLEDFMKKCIVDIFGRKNKLIYYDVSVTQYEQKQVCLQNQLFQFIENGLRLQNAKGMKQQKKMTKKQISKVAQRQIIVKEGDLIQKGLEDHYQSEFCYQQSINVVSKKVTLQSEQTIKDEKIKDFLGHYKYFERMKLT